MGDGRGVLSPVTPRLSLLPDGTDFPDTMTYLDWAKP